MKLIKVLVLAYSIAISVSALANDMPHSMATSHQNIDDLTKSLTLSNEQVTAISTIQRVAKEQLLAFRKGHDWSDFKDMMTYAPDSTEYDLAVNKVEKMSADMASYHVEVMTDVRKKIYALLNEQQKVKFLSLKPRNMNKYRQIPFKVEKPAAE